MSQTDEGGRHSAETAATLLVTISSGSQASDWDLTLIWIIGAGNQIDVVTLRTHLILDFIKSV